MLMHLTLSLRSLRLSSVLFIFYPLFCSLTVISTILSSSSIICFSASVILLFVPSTVFLLPVIFVIHICLFVLYFFYVFVSCINCFKCFLHFSFLFSRLWNILTITILNSFLGSICYFLFVHLFLCFYRVPSFVLHFLYFHRPPTPSLLHLRSPFPRC